VVDVSVGEQNGVDALSVDRKWFPVALSQLFIALVEPTVDEDPRARRAQQKAAARYGLGRAQKFQNRSVSRSTHTDSEACTRHGDCSNRDEAKVLIDSWRGSSLHREAFCPRIVCLGSRFALEGARPIGGEPGWDFELSRSEFGLSVTEAARCVCFHTCLPQHLQKWPSMAMLTAARARVP